MQLLRCLNLPSFGSHRKQKLLEDGKKVVAVTVVAVVVVVAVTVVVAVVVVVVHQTALMP